MLPGYASYYLGSESLTRTDVVRAGLSTTAGFVAVFTIVGIVASAVRGLLLPFMAYFLLVAAVIIAIMGLSMLAHRPILSFLSRVSRPERRGHLGLLAFGVAYGLSSLSCTAPVFFSLLVFSIATGGFVNLVVTFLVYALGMGALLIAFSLVVGQTRRFTVSSLSRFIPLIERGAALAMFMVAGYLVYLFPTYLALYSGS